MTFYDADGSLFLPTDFAGLLFAYDIDNVDTSVYANGQGFPFWTDFSGNNRTLVGTDPDNLPVYTKDAAGGLNGIYWFNASCPLARATAIEGVRHVFIVALHADQTFAGYEGLLTDLETTALLVGGAAGTKIFFDNNFDAAGAYGYKLNRQSFSESAQRAPTGAKLGVVSIKLAGGWDLDGLQVGRDRDYPDRKWTGAVRKIYGFDRVLSADEETLFIKFLQSSSELLHAAWIGTGTGLDADYFNNTALSGSPVLERTDAEIDFNWGLGSPDALVNTEQFSARWTGYIQFPFDGDYRVSTHVDDGVRLYLSGILAVDDWRAELPRTLTTSVISAKAGQYIPVTLEFFEETGFSEIQLLWSHVRIPLEIIPQDFLYPAIPSGPTVLAFNGSIMTSAGEILTFDLP